MTDIRLRSFNGIHLVKKVREESPETAVIIMTGYDEPLMQLEASRYSAQFLKKPIKSAELLDAVRRSVVDVRRERRWPRKRVARRLSGHGGGPAGGGRRRQLWRAVPRDSGRRRGARALRRRSLGHQPASDGRARLVVGARPGRAPLRRRARLRRHARRAHVARDRRPPLRLDLQTCLVFPDGR